MPCRQLDAGGDVVDAVAATRPVGRRGVRAVVNDGEDDMLGAAAVHSVVMVDVGVVGGGLQFVGDGAA